MEDHIFRIDRYENLLPRIRLTSEEIVIQVSEYHLDFPQERNQFVEWGVKLPMFVTPFYEFIQNCNMIPTQEEAFRYYLSSNEEYFSHKQFSDEIMEGVKARFYRTYPSLVRDVCFNKYVEENLKDYVVMYNTTLDIEEGIDLMLAKDEEYWGICLYTDTTRAYKGREAKKKRHILFSNVTFIEFPVVFRGSRKAGDFFLYGKKEFNELMSRLGTD